MELVPLGPGFGVEVKGVTMLDVATDADIEAFFRVLGGGFC